MGGHQELLSGVTPWTRGCFFTKTTLGDVVHYVTGDPHTQGNMLDGPYSEDTGNRSCTVFGDQCELGTKWDGSPFPG